ncbi:unnamed protein product [Rhizophagus irregularis]|nr:unnamed protein product [Rhizophagus irregularis]
MEEEWFFQQQGNKVTPKELKDCPDCGKPRISFGWGGFSSVYSALWMEGPRWIWDDGAQEWTRAGPMNVALKRLDNSQNISSSYIDQIKAYHKCLQSASLAGAFGITKDPTSNYMIVMKYYENGLTTVSFPNYNDSNVRCRYKKFFHSYLLNVNVNHVNCRPHYVHSSVEPRPNRTQFIIPARIEILGPVNEFTRFHEIHSEFI